MSEALRIWIIRALSGVQFGKVILVIHNGEVVRIDTEARVKIE
jgi:hypothetical protein